MKTNLILVLLIFSSFFLGCSDSATNTGTGNSLPPTAQLTAGSTFTYNEVTIDTLGNIDPLSAITTIDSVAEVGVTIYGMTNVTHIVSTSFDLGWQGTSDRYLYKTAYGDFIINELGASDIPNTWVQYPVHSFTNFSKVLLDSVDPIQGHAVIKETTSFGGIVSQTVKDSTFTCSKINVSLDLSLTNSPDQNVEFHIHSYMIVSPKLGYIVKERREPYAIIGSGQTAAGVQRTLIDYHIQ